MIIKFSTFKVPEGWTERKVGAGDVGGYAWTNPNDPTQEIEAIESGNAGQHGHNIVSVSS